MGIPSSSAFRQRRQTRNELIKWLGSLPLIQRVLQELDVRDTVDRLCPIRNVADYTHGQVVELLIANRLTSQQPLYAVGEWAADCAAASLWQMDPDKLNDDRLARTLDAISENLSGIQGAVAVSAIKKYGLEVDQAHIDATSFLFDGRYDEADQDEEYPVIKRGYNGKKDRRKQLRGTMSTIRDGSVSVFHQAFDGNRVDTTTLIKIVESFEKIRREAEVKSVIYVGDSKLASKNNLGKLLDLNVNFVCPAERNKQIQADILSLDPESWTELPYASESELKRRKKAPEQEWNRFWGQEAEKVLELPVKGKSGERKQHRYRVIYVRSAEEERAASKNRERQMEKTEKDLTRVQNGIPRYYKDSEAIRKKAQDVLAKHRTSSFYNIEIVTENGSPFLKWSHNQEALDHEERTRGRYALLTNLSSEQYSMNDVLTQQKGQYRVEHRFSRWKGPIGVSPIFLKKNQRVAAMVILTALALTVFCLIEREIRKKLCDKDGYTRGFLPENRKSRPTGKTIFKAVDNIFALVPEGERAIGRVCNISALAGKIYEALGVDLAKIENA